MCEIQKPGKARYIDRVVRIAEALERGAERLNPDEQKLAERVFDVSNCLTDDQLSTLEHKLFAE